MSSLLTQPIQEIMTFCHMVAAIQKESGEEFAGWQKLVNFAIESVTENLIDMAKPYPIKSTAPLATELPTTPKKRPGRPRKVN